VKMSRFQVNSPERVVDDREGEFEIPHDPVDAAVIQSDDERGEGDLERGGNGGCLEHLHSFNDGVDLVSPLRSFCLASIEHDTMLNLSVTRHDEIRFVQRFQFEIRAKLAGKKFKNGRLTAHNINPKRRIKERGIAGRREGGNPASGMREGIR
jgi:hypothetical protein